MHVNIEITKEATNDSSLSRRLGRALAGQRLHLLFGLVPHLRNRPHEVLASQIRVGLLHFLEARQKDRPWQNELVST